jgi:hypothetical protein
MRELVDMNRVDRVLARWVGGSPRIGVDLRSSRVGIRKEVVEIVGDSRETSISDGKVVHDNLCAGGGARPLRGVHLDALKRASLTDRDMPENRSSNVRAVPPRRIPKIRSATERTVSINLPVGAGRR